MIWTGIIPSTTEHIRSALLHPPVGQWGTIWLRPQQYIGGAWQGGQNLQFKRLDGMLFKFGTLPPKNLQESIDFVHQYLKIKD